MLTLIELEDLHKLSSNNKKEISNAKLCGCFYCQRIFNANQVVEYAFRGQDAICPYCKIDSVIVIDGLYKSMEEAHQILGEMYHHWFDRK